MQKVTLTFSNNDARTIAYLLRIRYNCDKRATLRGLCEMAVRTEVANQARVELKEAEKELESDEENL